MKCSKRIVLTGYRVQFVDLREQKPRTPQEETYIVDQQWHDAMGLLGLNVLDAIKNRYERSGFHVCSVEVIKPKRVVDVDLSQLWESAEQSVTEEQAQEASGQV